MNLVSLARSGWAAASNALHDVADYVTAHTSAANAAQVNASLTVAKQTASDMVSAGDGVFADVAGEVADGLVTLLNAAVSKLGYAIDPATGLIVDAVERKILPFEQDAVHRLRDFAVGQVHAFTLNLEAKIAGLGAPAPLVTKTQDAPLPPVVEAKQPNVDNGAGQVLLGA